MKIRHFWVWLHRWAGLGMAGFLMLLGLTGSILAFWNELNHWLTPNLYPGLHAGVELDAASLARRAESLAPQARATQVYLGYIGTAFVAMEAREGSPELGFDQIYLDNVSGAELGRLQFGELPTTLNAVMPFIYELHYNLALGRFGKWILGTVALIWTLDCFVAFYLTIPTPTHSSSKSFFFRWKSAWLVKWGAAYRVNFDLHRAGGLWLWAMLIVFAWSSVYFNMKGVYTQATQFFVDYEPQDTVQSAHLSNHNHPQMEWEDVQNIAKSLMDVQAREHDFKIDRVIALYHLRERGIYHYRVHSSRDVGEKYGMTSISIDAYSGRLLATHLPTGQHSGNTFTTWLVELHMANVFGRPYQILVCCSGFVVAMLSVTGVYIWWRKRAARLAHVRRPAARPGPAE